MPLALLPNLSQTIAQISSTEPTDESRKDSLLKVAEFIQTRHSQHQPIALVFICTHNSRRSHLGQIWAKVWAEVHGIEGVMTYSGGTEATAFNPNAIQALQTQGFEIHPGDETTNPHYQVAYAADRPHMEAWSKVYTDDANPKEDFCAIMTCSEADEACPAVFGASLRISLPYEDPKKSDGTPQQAQTYLDRSVQIAGEMAYVFEQAKK